MVDKKYDAKADTFMGGILVNLGYITAAQRTKADVLDGLAKQLQTNNSSFKKPFYGAIAGGDGASKILAEYDKQVADGKLTPDSKLLESMRSIAGTKLGVKGEAAGSDLERKGGPIQNSLQVQKELRDLERMGLLPDSAEKMKETTQGIADKLKLDYPDKSVKQAEAHVDVEKVMQESVESGTKEKEPVEPVRP